MNFKLLKWRATCWPCNKIITIMLSHDNVETVFVFYTQFYLRTRNIIQENNISYNNGQNVTAKQ